MKLDRIDDNLTPREYFLLHGQLPNEVIEALLDISDEHDDLQEAYSSLENRMIEMNELLDSFT